MPNERGKEEGEAEEEEGGGGGRGGGEGGGGEGGGTGEGGNKMERKLTRVGSPATPLSKGVIALSASYASSEQRLLRASPLPLLSLNIPSHFRVLARQEELVRDPFLVKLALQIPQSLLLCLDRFPELSIL